jgi:hypothetical protein
MIEFDYDGIPCRYDTLRHAVLIDATELPLSCCGVLLRDAAETAATLYKLDRLEG